MNPGGFTYTAHSIRDTIKGVKIPYIEVHLSNHYERGIHSVIASAAPGSDYGFGHPGIFLRAGRSLGSNFQKEIKAIVL